MGDYAKTGAAVGTAISPGIGSLIGAGAGFLVDAASTQRTMAAEQEMYHRNQREQFALSQQSQRNAAANEVAGLRAAGLSPVSADGAQGMSVGSAPLQNKQAPSMDPQLALLLSNIKLNDANANKANADARGKNIENDINEGKNKTSAENMKLYFTKMADETTDPDLKAYFKKQAEYAGTDEYNVGNYQAFLDYLDVQGKSEEAIARRADKKLSAWLAELRWNAAKGQTSDSSPFVRALVSLDARQSDLVAEQVANLIAQRKNVDKDTELVGAKLSLTNAQVEQVRAAAAALQNTNVMEFIEKGEYGSALLAMLLMVFSGVANKGVSYVQ